jgi:glycerol-3-phosphate dehydrogenase
VIVIGGGVIGAGTALDLAGRGLRVALVERSDLAQGTSSRSTKLFHGGIRYLPQMHFQLVSEGLREQKVLARIADFLFEPLEFVIPLYEQYGIADAPAWAASGWRAPLALRAGLTLYDVLGGVGRPGGRHRKVAPGTVSEMMPLLKRDGLKGGFVYSDAQTDDARLVVTVAKTAVDRFETVVVTRAEVERIEPSGDGFRLTVADGLSGDRLTVDSRGVVAATGAFDPPGLESARPLKLTRSKGTHLLAAPGALGLDGRALVLPETDDGRVMYIVPWLGHSMIGTTDTGYSEDPEHPIARPEDVEYLVRHVKRYLEVPDFVPIASFAGLRALKATENGSTAQVSREHVIEQPVDRYVQVAGGKLTTYRRIAAEVGDVMAAALGNPARSNTAAIPLVGANGSPAEMARRLGEAGLAPSAVQPTIARYGTESESIARIIEADPSVAAVMGDGRSSLADAVYAVRHEGAVGISDVTLRRTHLAWFTSDHARQDAPAIAAVMAAELGWSAGQTSAELARHERELVAEGL